MVLDALDGRVARMTNTQSAFGEQMDSLCDMVSFGVAPALMAYKWALKGSGPLGLDCGVCLLLVCSAAAGAVQCEYRRWWISVGSRACLRQQRRHWWWALSGC